MKSPSRADLQLNFSSQEFSLEWETACGNSSLLRCLNGSIVTPSPEWRRPKTPLELEEISWPWKFATSTSDRSPFNPKIPFYITCKATNSSQLPKSRAMSHLIIVEHWNCCLTYKLQLPCRQSVWTRLFCIPSAEICRFPQVRTIDHWALL